MSVTIKEVEELAGMTRANIRFYEKEGLIAPQRDNNGYRNYTEDDIEALKRIRLLRTIHVSLEDIRALSRNEKEFTELLITHLRTLKKEHQKLEQSRMICEQLCRDQVSYDSFDAQHYLNLLDMHPSEIPLELKEDSMPKVTAPWRRYFARMVDEALYMTIWDSVLALVFHINILEMGWLSLVMEIIMCIVLLMLAEPVMLSKFGTTPGKFLFGLRVTAESGARLTWREACWRTWTVLRKGYGFYIPFYCFIREFISYRACKKGELLEWEEDNILWLDRRHGKMKTTAAVLALAGVNGLTFFIWQAGAIPQNRGDITAAQYAENFNDMQKFYQIDRQLNLPDFLPLIDGDSMLMLNQNGEWDKMQGSPYMNTRITYAALPEIQFMEKEGFLNGLAFSAEYENENVEIVPYGDLMALMAMAFVCAQDDYAFFTDPPSLLYYRIKEAADSCSDFTIAEAGVTVEAEFECSGYELRQAQYSSSDVFVPVYGEEPYFWVEYKVYKEKRNG